MGQRSRGKPTNAAGARFTLQLLCCGYRPAESPTYAASSWCGAFCGVPGPALTRNADTTNTWLRTRSSGAKFGVVRVPLAKATTQGTAQGSAVAVLALVAHGNDGNASHTELPALGAPAGCRHTISKIGHPCRR